MWEKENIELVSSKWKDIPLLNLKPLINKEYSYEEEGTNQITDKSIPFDSLRFPQSENIELADSSETSINDEGLYLTNVEDLTLVAVPKLNLNFNPWPDVKSAIVRANSEQSTAKEKIPI